MFKTEMSMANPSRFSLPTYGRTSGITAGDQVDIATCGIAVRDRVVGHAAVAVTLTKGAFPGTSAWRPPIC
ncbi:MAG: hypothetical protein U0R80_05180 [Nocardioidaceae bacterium]